MLKSIQKFFSPPAIADAKKAQDARFLNAILWVSLFLFVSLEIIAININFFDDATKFIFFALILLVVIMQFVMRMGYVKEASIITLATAWVLLVFQSYKSSAIYDSAFISTIAIVLLAGLLLDTKYSFLFAMLTIGIGWIFAYFQTTGEIQTNIDKPYTVAIAYTAIFILTVAISYLTITSLRKAVNEAYSNTVQLSKSNDELKALQTELEARIKLRTSEVEARSTELAERTTELELANARTQKRAGQLQAISEVARVIAQVRKLNDLLPRIVKVISEQFDFYHTGIFLIDEANQYAILSAASSQGGKKMLVNRYRLRVGAPDVVGYVTESGNARIALNTDQNTNFSNNLDLPNTRSEMAVPLISGNKIIGALDIHSEQPNAFSKEDTDVIQILADQVSIAIENARLFDSTKKSISESETIYRQYIHNEWLNLATAENILGFRYTVAGATPLENLIDANEIKKAAETGQTITDADPQSGQAILAVPIKLREEVIGVLNIRTPGKQNWTQDEIGLVQAVAERVAVSAENARLFDQTTSRAERESAVSEITSKIRSTNDPDEMIQIAVDELKRMLNLKDVHVVSYNHAQNENERKDQ